MHQDEESDQFLVEQAQRGNQGAFQMLYQRYYADTYRYLFLYPQFNKEDAEDLTQEVFTNVSRRLPSLQQSTSFKGWLRSIARNKARDELRKRNCRIQTSSLSPDFEMKSKSISPEELVIIIDLIERALNNMAVPKRTCLLLHSKGSKPQAIARKLNLTEGSVRTYISQAHKELLAALRAAFTGQ
jgi:RNA polymerase sigma-70 factor (ECF subfamily)